MFNGTKSRRGFALAIALVAIVVIGTLIGGVFFASMQQKRIVRNQHLQSQALAMAEYGMNRSISDQWQTASWNGMAVGAVDSTTNSFTSHGATANVTVMRIGDSNTPLFLVSSQGVAGSSIGAMARRRTSTTVSLQPLTLNLLGALTTHGALKIGGSSFIDGRDTPYSGWSCPSAGPDLPGIATDDASDITTSGCSNLSCVAGSPKVDVNPSAGDTTNYFNFGNNVDWAALTAMGKIISGSPSGPSVSNGACRTSDPGNWGDPNRAATPGPCENYFPILYAPGDLHLTGGRGQGILLVEGNLHVSGGFEFYGPVIVRKDMDTQGTGGHFNGGLMAANVNLDQNTVLGNAVITYSSCVISKVLQSSAVPSLMTGRAWAELF
jgi:hypothetical protein